MKEMAATESKAVSKGSRVDPLNLSADLWRERFDTPGTNFLAMTSVMRGSAIMNRIIGEILDPYELTRVGYLFLMTLHLSPEGAEKLGRISRYLLVHPTTVTMMADQFESRNLVVRRPHPSDRRAVLCEITPAGRRLVERSTSDLSEGNFGLGQLSDDQSEVLLEMMHSIYHQDTT